MKIKLILSTGKEIELTEEEYQELKKGKVYDYTPVWPYYITNPWAQPTVIYGDGTGTACTTDCVATKTI